MPKYDNNLSGVAFKNEKKNTPKHPDYTGSAEIEGVEYWVSVWINVAKSGEREGEKFLSIKFTEKEEKRGGKSSSKSSRRNDDDDL